jgi:hypothetical protein
MPAAKGDAAGKMFVSRIVPECAGARKIGFRIRERSNALLAHCSIDEQRDIGGMVT